MVAPTAFGFNEQAAQDNHFMHAGSGGGVADPSRNPGVTRTVLQEFAGLHHQLSEVCLADVPPWISQPCLCFQLQSGPCCLLQLTLVGYLALVQGH